MDEQRDVEQELSTISNSDVCILCNKQRFEHRDAMLCTNLVERATGLQRFEPVNNMERMLAKCLVDATLKLREREQEIELLKNAPLCADHAQVWFTARNELTSGCVFCNLNNTTECMTAELSLAEMQIAKLQAKLRERESKLAAIVKWLEANQEDVFRRGLWDAINAATLPTPPEEEQR